MTKQELDDRIEAVKEAIREQRAIVQNCTARKPAIREANYLEELLTDYDYLIELRKKS